MNKLFLSLDRENISFVKKIHETAEMRYIKNA